MISRELTAFRGDAQASPRHPHLEGGKREAPMRPYHRPPTEDPFGGLPISAQSH